MPCITTCPKCGKAYEAASEELANQPTWAERKARWCPDCLARHRKKLDAVQNQQQTSFFDEQ